MTTFVPVYYLEKTFGYLGFQTSWDGTTWAMTAQEVTVKPTPAPTPSPAPTGQKYPDGWTAPVITTPWSPALAQNDDAGELKVFQDELGLINGGHTYTVDGQPDLITIFPGPGSGAKWDVEIQFRMWGPSKYDPNWEAGVPSAYRVPVIAQQLFKFYFGSDYMKVWNYFNLKYS